MITATIELTDANNNTAGNTGHSLLSRGKESLQKEITALITPYRSTEEDEPPFSAAELIVIAVLSQKEDAISVKAILAWIIRTFAYYQELAIEEYTFIREWEESQETLRNVVDGFYEALDDCNVPLQHPENHHTIRSTYSRFSGIYSNLVSVPPAAGRIFLCRYLEPKRVGVFKFLELPAELRDKTYEMVFSLPESGVAVGSCKSSQITLLDRPGIDPVENPRHNAFHLKGPPLHKLLALLSVNKQIYKESMSYFYQLNYFHFRSKPSLTNFVPRIAPARLSQLRHVRIDYDTYMNRPFYRAGQPFNDFQSALATLAEHVRLEKLRVLVDEDFLFTLPEYVRMACGHYAGPYTNAGQLPGMSSIAIMASRANEYEFRRYCADTAEYLKCPKVEAYVNEYVRKIQAGEDVEMESSSAKFGDCGGFDSILPDAGSPQEVDTTQPGGKSARFKKWRLRLPVRQGSAWRWMDKRQDE